MPDVIKISWPDTSDEQGARGVYAFAVGYVSPKRTVFASCAHGLDVNDLASISIEDNEGPIHTIGQNLNPVRYPLPVTGLDLVFWCVDRRFDKSAVLFCREPASRQRELSFLQPDWETESIRVRKLQLQSFRDMRLNKYRIVRNDRVPDFRQKGISTWCDVLDATPRPGSSGGPLWNPRGQIVGMLVGGRTGAIPEYDIHHGTLCFLSTKTILNNFKRAKYMFA